MSFKLLKQLENKFTGGVYLISGDDGLLIKNYTFDIEKRVKNINNLSILKYSYPDLAIEKLFEIYSTCDMFASLRCIFYRGIEDIEDKKLLSPFLKSTNPDCLLLLIDSKGSIKEMKQIITMFQQNNSFIEIKTPDKYDFIEFIREEGDKLGLKLSNDAIRYFIEEYGYSPSRILPELLKLKTFLGENKSIITLNELKNLRVSYIQDDFFGLLDSIFDRNLAKFLKEFKNYVIKDISLLGFISVCIKNLRIIKYYKYLLDENIKNPLCKVEDFCKALFSKPLNYHQKNNLPKYSRLDDSFLNKLEETLAYLEKSLKTSSEKIRATETELLISKLLS
ncbi:MAG: DNA polymerase III subunit delta [Candidatus Hydrogenedentota bacterium]